MKHSLGFILLMSLVSSSVFASFQAGKTFGTAMGASSVTYLSLGETAKVSKLSDNKEVLAVVGDAQDYLAGETPTAALVETVKKLKATDEELSELADDELISMIATVNK